MILSFMVVYDFLFFCSKLFNFVLKIKMKMKFKMNNKIFFYALLYT